MGWGKRFHSTGKPSYGTLSAGDFELETYVHDTIASYFAPLARPIFTFRSGRLDYTDESPAKAVCDMLYGKTNKKSERLRKSPRNIVRNSTPEIRRTWIETEVMLEVLRKLPGIRHMGSEKLVRDRVNFSCPSDYRSTFLA